MNILYGVQGTGHGHISRARELLPLLRQYASVDVIISGHANQLSLDEITYQKYGISLTYDSAGGVSVLNTLRDFRPIQFMSDIQSIPLQDYDLVVSDYEPVSAWSAKLQNVPVVGLSHQAAFLSPNTPRPERRSLISETLLRHFAPVDRPVGVHFKSYDDFVSPPIIRKAIRELDVKQGNHITVYLPAYHHQVLQKIFAPFTHVDWHIFSPSCKSEYQSGNCWIYPISNQRFLDSFASCRGVICNAGFETCAEAMFLGKKLLAVPIRNQYEQACNAAALQQLGVTIINSLENKQEEIWYWLQNRDAVAIDEIANPKSIVQHILDAHNIEEKNMANSQSLFRAIC
ncbi:hypothetical protein LX73_2182 [Fodinibius salinus]|uniref:Glycosyl transferase n=1 Tax=Fodinibius salinus TaxID=860790 RepID=A0A5D3YHE6_9BACT|nr:glycosyltransferase family protein [Fodinibius salinus]TYP91939.1 hypothetical protein LX73_2182 [Fodinibius salinus]